MMDEYIDHYFSSTSWADGDVKESSCWGYVETGQPNLLLPASIRLYENDKGNPPLSMISSKPSVEKSPITLGVESNYAVDKCLISGNTLLQNVSQSCRDKASPTMNCSLQYDTALPTLASFNLTYPNQLPVVDELTSSPSLAKAGIVHNGIDSERLEYHRSFKEMQNLSMARLRPSASNEGVLSMSALMGQDSLQQLGLQEGNLDDETDFMRKRYVSMDRILQLDKLSATSTIEVLAISDFI